MATTTKPPAPPSQKPRRSTFPLAWLVVALALAVSLAFLLIMPGGALTYADMIGYAVCHRMESHSFAVANRQLPLCARCSGTFIGALLGLLGQAVVLRRHRALEFPPPIIIVILAAFMLLWAADGLNSYLTLFPNPLNLYQPQNWLRLTTGSLNGLALSALIYPVFNFTLWKRPEPKRAIKDWRDLLVLLLLEACLIGLIFIVSDEGTAAMGAICRDGLARLSNRWAFLLRACTMARNLISALGPLLLYLLAFLSALGVLTLLTSVNSMLVLTLVRRENVADNWRETIIPLLAGFTVSLVQISLIDLVRYAITDTLSGIPLLN